MSTLLVAVMGSSLVMRTKRGAHFVPRSPWAARKAGRSVAVEPVESGAQLHGRHDLVAHDRIGHGVDGGQGDVGMALQDPLDRRRGEVLAVHPQPVVVAPGEIEEPVLVPVGQVAGPVPALAQAGPLRLLVAPVALEAGAAALRDELADGLLRIEETTPVVEAGRRALLAGGGVEDDGSLGCDAQGARGRVGRADHRGAALGRPVGIGDHDIEALGESGDVVDRALVAEGVARVDCRRRRAALAWP